MDSNVGLPNKQMESIKPGDKKQRADGTPVPNKSTTSPIKQMPANSKAEAINKNVPSNSPRPGSPVKKILLQGAMPLVAKKIDDTIKKNKDTKDKEIKNIKPLTPKAISANQPAALNSSSKLNEGKLVKKTPSPLTKPSKETVVTPKKPANLKTIRKSTSDGSITSVGSSIEGPTSPLKPSRSDMELADTASITIETADSGVQVFVESNTLQSVATDPYKSLERFSAKTVQPRFGVTEVHDHAPLHVNPPKVVKTKQITRAHVIKAKTFDCDYILSCQGISNLLIVISNVMIIIITVNSMRCTGKWSFNRDSNYVLIRTLHSFWRQNQLQAISMSVSF